MKLTATLLTLAAFATVAAIYGTAEAIHHAGLNPFDTSPAIDASPSASLAPAAAVLNKLTLAADSVGMGANASGTALSWPAAIEPASPSRPSGLQSLSQGDRQ